MADEKKIEKKAEKPAEKKTDKATAKKGAKPAKAEPVIKTILQFDGKDIDVSTIANDTLKNYKSVHKRKAVAEFVVYIKPEENAAYFTVNGEGSPEFKVDL